MNEDKSGGLPLILYLSEEQFRDQQKADSCLGEDTAQPKTGEKLPMGIHKSKL